MPIPAPPPRKLTDRERAMIANLPPADGWWKKSGETQFQKTALVLMGYGIPFERVIDILQDLYYAVANEYGGG